METMRIAQVAARSGVPPTTLRYYEDRGLLNPDRAPNGYRVFDAEVLERLRFIDAAKQLGLPLDQIGSLLRVWQADPCASVKAHLRPLLAERLEQIDAGITELTQVRHELAAAAQHLDELPDRSERCSPECAFLAPARPPVACSLGSGQAERVEQWRRVVAGARRQRTPGGVRIELATRDLAEVTKLAVAEQECCPFLAFDISLHGTVFTLTVAASPEGMAMVDALFGTANTEPAPPSDEGASDA